MRPHAFDHFIAIAKKIQMLQYFLEGECVIVTGLSENQGKLLKCVFYPKYYKFILK